MVPGRDPDLRAPAPRAICIHEISVQMELTTDGKRNSNLLPNLSCSLYQQQTAGKSLVHRGRLVQGTPRAGEPGMVLAATLPRSAVVSGTFQVKSASIHLALRSNKFPSNTLSDCIQLRRL
ncbi:unnamed protein product [Sphacelaria rigidula]